MNTYEILKTIDFIDGRVDLESIHPSRLEKLISEGFVERIDPEDGENDFYTLSVKGEELMKSHLNLG